MGLEIQNQRIVGTIDNLQEKLNGELPINKLELLYLVNSWGRNQDFYTNENIIINQCKATKCYDLSKLDTSEITDMSRMFRDTLNFNQALNNWDVSNVTTMYHMFQDASNFNQALNNWDVSNVTDMSYMFVGAWNFNQALDKWNVSNVTSMSKMFDNAIAFNQALDNWDVSKVTYMIEMFYNARAFKTKFNNGNPLPKDTNNLKQWLNSDRMLAIEIKEREKENLDSFYNNLEILYNNLDKENNI